MAQHDYVIANGTGAAVRSDLNNALSAIVSQNSGATEPATMYAYQWWADTTTGLLKIRNAANNAWVTVGTLASANLGLLSSGGTITAALGSASTPGITFTGDTNTGIYSPGADQVAISTNGSGRLFVDSSGRVLVGASVARSSVDSPWGNFTPSVQFESTNNGVNGLSIIANATDGYPGEIVLGCSRGSSAGSNTAVQISQRVGQISFQGADGTSLIEAAEIKCEIDATPGTNDMPGRIVLSTTADGASAPTERMRIDSSGRVGINTTSPLQALHVYNGSNTIAAYLESTANVYLALKNTSQTAFIGATGANLTFENNGSERARIDSSGRLLVGTSTQYTVDGVGSSDFELSRAGQDSTLGVTCWRASSNAWNPNITFKRAYNDTAGNYTVVPNGAVLGIVRFAGADGSKFVNAAEVKAEVDGTAGTNDMPTRLVFSTTNDGASSPTERFRINYRGTHSIFSNYDALYINNANAAGTTEWNIYATRSATGNPLTGTQSFGVYTNGNVVNTNNSYAGISDVKLKENIVDAGSQWSDLKNLTVRKFNFKEGETHTQIGLIAQEAEQVSPGLVFESPDRDSEGNDLGTVTKSVNYSVLYMKAVKALQEAMERIESLEAKVAALEAA